MKDIKNLFISLPVFNFILIVALYGLLKLEMYFFHISENPAPILLFSIFYFLDFASYGEALLHVVLFLGF